MTAIGAGLAEFDREGFLRLPRLLPPELLEAVRTEVGGLLARLQPHLPATELEPGPPGVGHIGTPTGRSIIRVDGLVEQHPLASVLALLGCPAWRTWATALAEDALIAQVDLVVRRLGDGHVIAWHQDAVYPRTHRHAALGLALDDTGDGDGDLLVLPGTQTAVQDLCALEEAYGFSPPGLRRIAPHAGDLVIHDAMLVHGSLPLAELAQRRTLYVYVDSAARLLATEPANAPWAAWRQSLWTSAAAAWEAFESGRPEWRDMVWEERLAGPPRQRPMALAGNYCIRVGGKTLGNTADLFSR